VKNEQEGATSQAGARLMTSRKPMVSIERAF